ncbi:MAG: hypothetical protein VYA20_03065 [Candidatus Neomarinimicrobiota bacterium]|nr:hypothetical protein [Candidatus Neomarinimicrobiota bacterium]
MKKYNIVIFLFSLLYPQNTISDDIVSFIDNLNNKTMTLSIDSSQNETKLSILDERIYFDTFSANNDIVIIDKNEIKTYDFDSQLIIIESADETFLDLFYKQGLLKYKITNIDIKESLSLVTYSLDSRVLVIEFDNTLKQIVSIEIQDEGVSLLNAKVMDVINFDVPFLANNFDSWQILDWRD